MGQKVYLPAQICVAAVALLLLINGCHSQEEISQTEGSGSAWAMVDEEGQPWWDPSAITSRLTTIRAVALSRSTYLDA